MNKIQSEDFKSDREPTTRGTQLLLAIAVVAVLVYAGVYSFAIGVPIVSRALAAIFGGG